MSRDREAKEADKYLPFPSVLGGAPLRVEVLGAKAHGLQVAHLLGCTVAPGFCVPPVDVKLIATDAASTILDDLRRAYNRLTREPKVQSLILRSSSIYEDDQNHQFAGLLTTIKNISSFEDLISGVHACYTQSRGDAVLEYFTRNGLDPGADHLALIVQAQCDNVDLATCQLRADDAYCEVDVKDGRTFPGATEENFSFTLKKNDGVWVPELLSRHQMTAPASTWNISRRIGELIERLAKNFSAGAITELGLDQEHIWVFQVRRCAQLATSISTVEGVLRADANHPLLKAEVLGLKAAAARYFSERGLFSAPIVVIPPFTRKKGVRLLVAEASFPAGPITARFSYKTDIGLPRYFAPNIEEALDWVYRVREPRWTTILQQYLEVRRSFELLVTPNLFMLEHVPGLWESENRLQPDVIYQRGNHGRIWRYRYPRQAYFGPRSNLAPSDTGAPISQDLAKRWLEDGERVSETIRRDFTELLPLNLHCVEDDKGRWQFLNIRRGFTPVEATLPKEPPMIIRSAQDLEHWDGAAPLLVRVAIARGDERKLLDLARALPRDGRPIYVDFGILSHPAIVLREYGVNIVPSYLLAGSEERANNEYEVSELTLNMKMDVLSRIEQEHHILRDERFHVVLDLHPVVPNHFLVVDRRRSDSFADSVDEGQLENVLVKLAGLPSVGPEGVVLFERGRASFCTSQFGAMQAHGHVVPAKLIAETALLGLARRTGAEMFSNLVGALSKARLFGGEYVLFGSAKQGFFLVRFEKGEAPPKRFIRKFLEEARVVTPD